MDLKDVLSNLKKSKRDWNEKFEDDKWLLSSVKKKGASLSKAERSRFRAFLKCGGNTRLLALKDAGYTQQCREIESIALQMKEEYLENYEKSYDLAWQFLSVICSHYEKMAVSRKLEEISANIFQRKIKEEKRFELLKKSHLPYEQYELGEICLKTEDYFDPQKAEQFYLAAAENGISDGLFTLGLYYQLDEKNYEKAKEIYDQLLSCSNPKGFSGLALLSLDPAAANPYFSLEKAREYAGTGMERRCGTSMYILSSLLMDENRKEAFKILHASRLFDANLQDQYAAAREFMKTMLSNVSANFPDFFKAAKETLIPLANEFFLYLFGCKYNLEANFRRMLETLKKLVLAIGAFEKEKKLSNGAILHSLGFSRELLDALKEQYTEIDESTEALYTEISGWLTN